LRTVLGGNDWAIGEWQTLEIPNVLLLYRQRLKDTNLDFDGRLARLRGQKAEADEFVERTFGLKPGTRAAAGSRSKAGYPPVNLDQQLRESRFS
jgi:hypothetical protein